MNNYVLIVLDSCRFDSFVAADPRIITRLGTMERRWSYASWTSPSHYNLLMGLLPHGSPRQVYASEYYKRDFARYNQRLGTDGIEFGRFVPSLYLPTFSQTDAGLPHPRHGLAPGAQPAHHPQPRLRLL